MSALATSLVAGLVTLNIAQGFQRIKAKVAYLATSGMGCSRLVARLPDVCPEFGAEGGSEAMKSDETNERMVLPTGRCRPSFFALLRAAGVEVNEEFDDAWGYTVLHMAAQHNILEVGRSAIASGVSVDAQDAFDVTPLHFAARAGHADFCELLLSHGATIDAVNLDGQTPLVAAAIPGHEDACKVLLEHGAGCGDLPVSQCPPLLASLLHD